MKLIYYCILLCISSSTHIICNFLFRIIVAIVNFTRLITYVCILRNSDNCPTGHMVLIFFSIFNISDTIIRLFLNLWYLYLYMIHGK
jgi:hypothetical protein